MRKRTVSNFFDNLMWYMIYLLPFIITIITTISATNVHFGTGNFNFTFTTHLQDSLLNLVSTDNIVFTTLMDIFGQGGIFELFHGNILILYFTYFINCTIIHVLVDTLVFLPRLFEKMLGKVVK